MKKTNVAIIGVGLIGGSLGMALRRTGRYRVMGLGRNAAKLKTAKRLGAADVVSTDLREASNSDIVVLAAPVASLLSSLDRVLPHLRKGTLVTDVGSVKIHFVKEVAKRLRGTGIHFVSGHPMAGSHKSGIAAARADLFQGATCALIPIAGASPQKLETLWHAAGAKTIRLSADAHDFAVAVTSHLPHVIAHALTQTALSYPQQKALRALMAGSFRDVTRVAVSDPEQWTQIFAANAAPLQQAIRSYARAMIRLASAIGKPPLLPLLRRSQKYRAPLFNGR